MAYIAGQSLREIISSRQLTLEEALDIAIQVANGLHEAHEKGIVHRDIKSANIMLTKKNQAKVLDFGLASWAGRAQPAGEEQTAGTIAYMSPEQLGSGPPIDHRTDIWALGILLYEMITGRLPFMGDYQQAIGYSILNEDPPPLAELRPGVPDRLQELLDKALTKAPGDRYSDLSLMLKNLLAFRGNLARGRPKKSYVAPLLRWVGGPLLAIMIAFSLLDYFSESGEGAALESVAVLPFENIRKDETLEWLPNALAEKLTFELSKLTSIRVVDRLQIGKVLQESQEQHTGVSLDVFGIAAAEKLNATLALVGSFTVYGDSIQFTTRLVEPKSGLVKPLVQEQYSLSDLRTLQNDISRKIVEEVEQHTSRAEP
jgi:serine/threonine protein kinase